MTAVSYYRGGRLFILILLHGSSAAAKNPIVPSIGTYMGVELTTPAVM